MIKNVHRSTEFIAVIFIGFLMVSCTSLKKQPSSRTSNNEKAEKNRDKRLISKYEQIIGTPISMHKSLSLYKAIDSWIGTPYRYGAMKCKKGTDCSGFVCSIYKEVYHVDLDRSSEDQLKNDIRRVGKRRLKEGDLVFFKIERDKKVSHVGIYLGNDKFVHASVQNGVCINGLDEKYYKEHFKAGGRVKANIAERTNRE